MSGVSNMHRCSNCFATNERDEICARCGYNERINEAYPNALTSGTILNGQYLVGRVLGQGGFGITYLGLDLHLEFKVAIKEYYPEGLVTRAVTRSHLTIYSGEKEQYFQYGAERFLEEAKILGKFQNSSSIVPVRAFFKENNTAYFVMDYIEGSSFKQYLKKMKGRILFGDAILLLAPIMEALEDVHKAGLLHRDISPENIYITNRGESKLLDFGAARYTLGEHSKSLSVILKPGYAPEEQYRSKGKQGSWTDVYALAATIYTAITGGLPPDALDRLDQDDIKKPSQLGVIIPPHAEAALMKALAVKAQDRCQTVRAFRTALTFPEKMPQNIGIPQSTGTDEYRVLVPNRQMRPPKRVSTWGTCIAVFAGIFFLGIFMLLFIIGVSALSADESSLDEVAENTSTATETEGTIDNSNIQPPSVFEERKEEVKEVQWRYIIQPAWSETQDFAEGLAAVSNGSAWGYIDQTGNLVIDYLFEDVRQFSNGIGMARQGEMWGSIDKTGMWLTDPWWDDAGFLSVGYKEGLVPVTKDDLWMFIDEKGDVVLQDDKCFWAETFSEGLALVFIDGKCGYIDKNGSFAVPLQWSSGWLFSEGVASVQAGEKWGFIDKRGNVTIQPQYNFAVSFTEGLAAVDIGTDQARQIGFINQYGEMVIEPCYEDAYDFRDGLSAVCINGKYGYIDHSGEMVIEPQWEDARSIAEGLAAVKENGLWGYIEITGQ